MIVIDNVPLVVNAKEGDKKQEQLEVVFAATNSPFIQRANSCYVNSHLSLSRSLSRTKKCIHVLQNETASVEFRVDDAVLASDDATTCVIAVVVCQATGVAAIAHFDELSSRSDACLRKFMSQHVGGRYCTYDLYLVGGMMEETLVGLRTSANLLSKFNQSPGKFNLKLCCVYDQNTCTQTGCPLVRSFGFDPLTNTTYHVSTSVLNLGIASIRRNISQHNLEALAQHAQSASASASAEDGGAERRVSSSEPTKEEQREEKEEKVKKKEEREGHGVSASEFAESKGKRLASGSRRTKLGSSAFNTEQKRGPGLERRLANYWLTESEDELVDLVNVYDTWDQKFVLTGRIHTVSRFLMVNYAFLLTLSDEDLLKKTSTTPQYEGENFCFDVRLALKFILEHAQEPSFTLYTQSYTWDPMSSIWMEVDKYTGKKMKHLQLQQEFNSIQLDPLGHHGGDHGALGKMPQVDIPGSSWSYTSLVDLEKEHLEAAGA